MRKFCETACLLGLITASINISSEPTNLGSLFKTSGFAKSNKSNEAFSAKPTIKIGKKTTNKMSTKTVVSDDHDDTKSGDENESDKEKTMNSKNYEDEEDDDDDDDDQEYFDSYLNDGECERIEDDDDDDDEDDDDDDNDNESDSD